MQTDDLMPREMSGALQRYQQLLNLVELYVIAGKARDVIGECIVLSAGISHVMLPSEFANADGSSFLDRIRHILNVAFCPQKIH